MKVRLLESAVRDLNQGRIFYEMQMSGLGLRFLKHAFAALDLLALDSGIHGKQFGYHRMLMRKFPYGIYDQIEENVSVVYRILDLRKDPKLFEYALRPPTRHP